jgi:phosphoribosylaminoimidazole-succinocarboxamide synthase
MTPNSALHTSTLQSLTLLARGKVRDNYAVGDDRILMVASDRLSAFDVIMGEPIPGKGVRRLTNMERPVICATSCGETALSGASPVR